MSNLSERLNEAFDKIGEDKEQVNKPRPTLAISKGKAFRTPKDNRLYIAGVTLTVDTATKESNIRINARVGSWAGAGEEEYVIDSVEELVDIYLNN